MENEDSALYRFLQWSWSSILDVDNDENETTNLYPGCSMPDVWPEQSEDIAWVIFKYNKGCCYCGEKIEPNHAFEVHYPHIVHESCVAGVTSRREVPHYEDSCTIL